MFLRVIFLYIIWVCIYSVVAVAADNTKPQINKEQLIYEVKKMKLSVKVAQMAAADQAFRFSLGVLAKKGISWKEISTLTEFKEFSEIDANNAREIKMIISEWGWPKISDFGQYTARNAWLIVQHMDQDVDFQKKCLIEMEKLIPLNEVSKTDYGYLFDRVQVNVGRLQRYGTQGRCVGKNKWEPKAIENPENLGKLRAEIGMSPMKDYIKAASELCP